MEENKEITKAPEVFIESLNKLVNNGNIAVMRKKTSNALAALSKILNVENEKENEDAIHILGRVKPTFEVVQKMRKEITEPFDKIKKTLIEIEQKISTAKGSNSEYTRVKLLCDAYASKKVAEVKEQQQKIELEKQVKIHKANLKSELEKSINEMVIELIKEGEALLVSFVSGMTIENFDKRVSKLNYTPKLSEDAFKCFFRSYDDFVPEFLTESDYQDVVKEMGEAYEYEKINEDYSKKALDILDKFKREIIPNRKKELLAISKESEAKQKEIAEKERQQLFTDLSDLEKTYEAEKNEAKEKAEDEAANVKIDAEFETQINLQAVAQVGNVRKKISYSIDEAILNKQSKIIDVLMKVISNVLMDAKFKGVIKRDSQGFPKKDNEGKIQLVDGVDYWLKELTKLKIDINIDHLSKVEEVSSTVKV